jgi:hypothetical protein
VGLYITSVASEVVGEFFQLQTGLQLRPVARRVATEVFSITRGLQLCITSVASEVASEFFSCKRDCNREKLHAGLQLRLVASTVATNIF